NGEKMSKSLGNFITIRELLDRPTDPMAVRLFVLQAHYRKPIDFTDDAIAAATNGWHTLREGLLFGHLYGEQLGWNKEDKETRGQGGQGSNSSRSLLSTPCSLLPEVVQRFKAAVNDDFNFPNGLAVLQPLAKELAREGNLLVHQGKTETPPEELQRQWYTLVTLAEVLGFTATIESDTTTNDGLSDTEIEAMLEQRQAARKAKNFAESDRIRDELQARGITVIDSRDGTRWHRN
ncbi:DALR domain-containing protein, partial [Chroococcidiopsis sp.]|uniref:DALR domain-containing protein n=1 Tax=Chroococcidiopsis sp. TaxID=3088168 RepID=UPI003F36E8CD